MRMMPLSEESSLQSAIPPTLQGVDTQQHAPEHLEPPAPGATQPAPRSMLRRTSQAALNRFSRNRASTVTGATPTLSTEQEPRPGEYGSHVVDVLDVIGRPPRRRLHEAVVQSIS